MKKTFLVLLIFALMFSFLVLGSAQKKQVSVLTPYLASVTTHTLIESFKEYAVEKGWDVTVIDTKGNFDELANRYEDVIAQGVDAIVMGMGDPNQLKQQIQLAEQEGIPVFGGDAGYIPSMEMNVTSNNYVLSAKITSYLFNTIGEGKVVKLYHSAHPGVHKREIIFDAMVESRNDIEVVAKHFVQVPGPIEDARKAMQSILLSHPDIDGVWAAWDEPAIGAALVIKQAGREKEIVVTGIDGTSKALEMIDSGSSIKASVKQNFDAMARILVEQIERVFNGKEASSKIMYAPATLVTESNVGDFLD